MSEQSTAFKGRFVQLCNNLIIFSLLASNEKGQGEKGCGVEWGQLGRCAENEYELPRQQQQQQPPSLPLPFDQLSVQSAAAPRRHVGCHC